MDGLISISMELMEGGSACVASESKERRSLSD